MKKLSLIILTFSIIIFGCSHTHKINLASEPSPFDEINTILKSQKARITLVSGRAFKGKGPQITRDSTFWFDPKTNEKHTVSNSRIDKIVVMKRWRGIWEGLGYGLLIGGAVGAIGHVIIGDPSMGAPGGPSNNLELAITAGWIAGFYSSTLIGCPIGLLKGSKDKYVFISLPVDSSLTNEMKH